MEKVLLIILPVFVNKARVIGVWDSKVDLVNSCLEETGGLGVDIVIDAGGEVQKSCILARMLCKNYFMQSLFSLFTKPELVSI